MRIVDLSCVDAFGLVVKATTGVQYSTQTGGMGCHHPEVEGYYIPINAGNAVRIEDDLHSLLCGAYSDYVEAPNVRAINAVLESLPWLNIQVDEECLEHTEEAWIHVIVIGDGGEFSPFRGLGGEKAVLLYGNCD